jgi:hypothetical protein
VRFGTNGVITTKSGKTFALQFTLASYWDKKFFDINCLEFSSDVVFRSVTVNNEDKPHGDEPLITPFVLPSEWAIESVHTGEAFSLSTSELSANYQGTTTRAEFCRAAVNFLRKYGYDVDSVTPKVFADTADKDIGIAAVLGITSGTDTAKNLFSPNSPLTREQAAGMLRNVMNVIGAEVKPENIEWLGLEWSDAKDISNWAKEAISVICATGIMRGTSTTELVFSPKTPYTHEQSIIALINLWGYVK